MKKSIITLSLFLCVSYSHAQNQKAEEEIRKLEQMEVQAVLQKDTVTLSKIWDKDYIVNSPANTVTHAGKSSTDRPVMKKARTTFTREIENITIRGNIAISMGGETVVPSGDEPNAGQTVKRRYTDIWEKQTDGWKLIARHANVVCQ